MSTCVHKDESMCMCEIETEGNIHSQRQRETDAERNHTSLPSWVQLIFATR